MNSSRTWRTRPRAPRARSEVDGHHYASGALVAEKLVKSWGLNLHVDPFAIADQFKITVAAKPASSLGVSGILVRVGNEFAIAYATHIDNEAFQRYSVAHELGHYFLPGHPEAVFDARGIHESRAQSSPRTTMRWRPTV